MAENKLRRLVQIAGRKMLPHHPVAVSALSEPCTPPYLALLPGLSAPQEQVVIATAYNLGKIAANLPEYQEEILVCLQQKAQAKRLSKAAAEQLAAIVSALQKSYEKA